MKGTYLTYTININYREEGGKKKERINNIEI